MNFNVRVYFREDIMSTAGEEIPRRQYCFIDYILTSLRNVMKIQPTPKQSRDWMEYGERNIVGSFKIKVCLRFIMYSLAIVDCNDNEGNLTC